MPHYKCVPCRTRLYTAEGPPEMVGDLCPDCGALLEPVGQLGEVIGFRSIKSRDDSAVGEAAGTRERIAGRVDDFLARRAAILALARLDAERWVDEGGSFQAEAVALPRPETYP
jgi:hypothetical protein